MTKATISVYISGQSRRRYRNLATFYRKFLGRRLSQGTEIVAIRTLTFVSEIITGTNINWSKKKKRFTTPLKRSYSLGANHRNGHVLHKYAHIRRKHLSPKHTTNGGLNLHWVNELKRNRLIYSCIQTETPRRQPPN